MSIKGRKHLTEAQKQEIINQYNAGLSTYQVAKSMNVSPSTAYRIYTAKRNVVTGQPVSTATPSTLTDKLNEIQSAYNTFKKYGLL